MVTWGKASSAMIFDPWLLEELGYGTPEKQRGIQDGKLVGVVYPLKALPSVPIRTVPDLQQSTSKDGKRPMKAADYSGQRFGRLVAVHSIRKKENGRLYWECKCDCGNTKIVEHYSLRSKVTSSCGCYHKDRVREVSKSHGFAGTAEYHAWTSMRGRCLNPESEKYKRYGGRGIQVCDHWKDFENFYTDMGPRPGPGYSIDRIDNNGNYEPGNCRWATRNEQARNRHTNNLLTYNGEEATLTEWSEKTGINEGTIRYRLKHGWEIGRALTEVPQR